MQEKLNQLKAQLDKHSHGLIGREAQVKTLESELSRLNDQLKQAETLDMNYQRVHKFFQSLGSVEQQRLQDWLEKLVTYGLRTVFEERYQFRILPPTIKAGEVVTEFVVVDNQSDNVDGRDPWDFMGGGVSDVVSFVLQFIFVYLLRDRISPIIFVDESFKHVSSAYRVRLAALVRELAEYTGTQIVFITHMQEFEDAADVVYQFERPGKLTQVTRIK